MSLRKRLARLEAQNRGQNEAIQVLRLIIDPGCDAPTAVMIRTQDGWRSIERQHHEVGTEFVERLD